MLQTLASELENLIIMLNKPIRLTCVSRHRVWWNVYKLPNLSTLTDDRLMTSGAGSRRMEILYEGEATERDISTCTRIL